MGLQAEEDQGLVGRLVRNLLLLGFVLRICPWPVESGNLTVEANPGLADLQANSLQTARVDRPLAQTTIGWGRKYSIIDELVQPCS